MTTRLAIITEIISPYRIPLFNALAQEKGIDLNVIFLSETDQSLRQWQVYKDEIRFPYRVLASWRRRIGRYNFLLNRGVSRALQAILPEIIVCGGYNYVSSWQALRWARARHVPFLLWSESNIQDRRNRRALVEFMKRKFFRGCHGFVVPGRSAAEYVKAYGVDGDNIFSALNAVDNNFFANASSMVRADHEKHRQELGLPQRYFLYAGRLVREKGVFDLLAAYARLNTGLREKISLVFAGDGVARQQLEAQAETVAPGTIKFTGFAQREQLAQFYALAEVLVLPTYTDPWGLVVNEAMAGGLPVIVSSVAGCAADLVQQNRNGFLVPPGDVESLTAAMSKIACNSELQVTMAANSVQRIRQYSPQGWAQAMSHMVSVMRNAHG